MIPHENFNTLSVADGKLDHLYYLAGHGYIEVSELTIDTSEGQLAITAENGALTIQRIDK